MKNNLLTLFLILCAWLGASTGQAQSPGSVLTWRGFFPPPLAVPVTAQSGVTAFFADGAVLGSINATGETQHNILHLWRAPSWAEIEAAEKSDGLRRRETQP